MKRMFSMGVLSLFFCAAVTGCNTISGVGKDLQKAGEKIEEAAKKNK
jgi:entericidin A